MLIRSGLLVLFVSSFFEALEGGTFSVDYNNRQFLKDGQPFRYISGSIHYMRVHPGQWNDRLQRIRALGLNAVQVYVPWNMHEPKEGIFDFSGGQNLTHFLTLAQQNGLNVLLRPGPYICAEWENGGFPYWLLKYDGIQLRTYDPTYIKAVQNYYNVLLDVVKPMLYKNGGPILMVQVENEYGYGPCNHTYTEWLRDLIWSKLGNDTVLYTTDGGCCLSCGHVPGALATVDFGIQNDDKNIDNSFNEQDKYNNGGPHVCSEYWVNWYVTWGQTNPSTPNPSTVVDNINHMFVNWNASINTYMIHGGTNYGFMAGSDGGGGAPMVTSYDYGAAIAENGDITPVYTAMRNYITKIPGWPAPPPVPANNPTTAYGQVTLTRLGTNLISTLSQIQETCYQSSDPLDFEQIDHGYGFVLYTTTLTAGGHNLSAPNIRDYGYVYVNNNYQGILSRDSGWGLTQWINVNANAGDFLRILVENRGREKIGDAVSDHVDQNKKGLHTGLTLDGTPLKNWYQCGINLTEASVNSLTSKFLEDPKFEFDTIPNKATNSPGVYVGKFTASQLTDTWMDSTGWNKGVAFINGFNLGRYWSSLGPQIALYVPKPVIQQTNTLLLIDCLGSSQNYVNFIDHPLFRY